VSVQEATFGGRHLVAVAKKELAQVLLLHAGMHPEPEQQE